MEVLASGALALDHFLHGRSVRLLMILDRYHALYLQACSFVRWSVDWGPRRIPCVFISVPLVSLSLYAVKVSATF
jgi:hypothetical protein